MHAGSDFSVIPLSGESDAYAAPRVRSDLATALGSEAPLVVDLTQATFIDSTIVGVLLEGLANCEKLERPLLLLLPDDAAPEVHRLFEITGLAALLPVVGDIRRIPAALHLAYLASGRLDCGLLVGAKLWDVAGGLVLAREAGVVLGGAGGTPSPDLVVAAAPGVWEEYAAGTAVQQLTAR